MISLEPVEPAIPTARPRLQPGKLRPGVDPLVPPRKPILTLGNCILAAFMIAFGLYATGNLPQFDRAFDSMHASLQSRNDAVVRTTMHFGPLLLGGFVLLLVLTFGVLRLLVRPPQASENMDWHSRAVEERARKTPKVQTSRAVANPSAKPDADSFFRPLHKQSKLRRAMAATQPLPSMNASAMNKSEN